MSDLLREVYVNVAEYDFALSGKDQTDSRVSLLTGVHRKEVSRLRGAGAPISAVPAVLSRSSRVLARWMASPDYTGADGKPIPLPRVAEHGPSFEALVIAVTRDVRPRAILDEWIDRGLVAIDEAERVVLLGAALIPSSGEDQQLYYFGRNMHDHMAAAVANILGEAPRCLERGVHYDGLSAETAALLETHARTLSMDLLREADREAHAASARDAGGHWRWTLGVYVYAAEEPETSTPDPAGRTGADPHP